MILEPKEINSFTVSIVSPSICHEAMGPSAVIFIFWILSFKPTFSLLSFIFIKRLCHKGVIICISEVTDIFPAILIPAYPSSSLAFYMMYSACNLNKRGNNIQPWHTPFPVWNHSVVPWLVLTNCCFFTYLQISQEPGQVVWYSNPFKNFPLD